MGSLLADGSSVTEPTDSVDRQTAAPSHEGSEDVNSTMTSPDPGHEPEVTPQDVVQTQKRKGGRKPIYATSEERKQRNRQAQAAFRERRTEYIKQLETTIKRHEENLQSLQQSHRSAADECLMLRYKNSLLERILLEKGIDVQAELRLKGASPHLGPTKSATSQASQMQRAAMNRQQNRRLPAGIAPKLDALAPATQRDNMFGMQSPQLQPTPSSHASSPATVRSPGYSLQGEMTPPGSGYHASQAAQQQHTPSSSHLPQLLPQHRQYGQHTSPGSNSGSAQAQAGAGLQQPYQSFQKQFGSIDSEFDAQTDMTDDQSQQDIQMTQGSYPTYQNPHQSQNSMTFNHHQSRSQQQHQHQQQNTTNFNAGAANANAPNSFDAYDPILDADPFGLGASMHFQTPFGYEQSQRQ